MPNEDNPEPEISDLPHLLDRRTGESAKVLDAGGGRSPVTTFAWSTDGAPKPMDMNADSHSSKLCFVIMPIKRVGTPEHKHFKALYDNVIAPCVRTFGYHVRRADDYQQSGSITKDIILPLARADLVVADLTDLNPNVFYELGVRHSLRGVGTIMIMDDKETGIPFDLTTYRVIKFKSDLGGIGSLTSELRTFIAQFETGAVDARDNLVHDLLPQLPPNALASASGSEAAELRTSLQELRRKLQAYRGRFGSIEGEAPQEGPSQVVLQALEEARKGDLPAALVNRAEESASGGDHQDFLEAVSRIVSIRTSRPTPNAMLRLVRCARQLELASVAEALLEHACAMYKTHQELRLILLENFAHSEEPSSRAKAREEFARFLGIEHHGQVLKCARPLTATDLATFSVMLDAYHRDELHADVFTLTSELAKLYPDKSIVLRNMARAHKYLGRDDEALKGFIAAVAAPDADDTSALWLGNELHNADRYVDAIEAYSVACLRDPDDAQNFCHLADDLSWALAASERRGHDAALRQLPAELLGKDSFVHAAICTIVCGAQSAEIGDRLRTACKRAEMDIDGIVAMAAEQSGKWNRSARLDLAKRFHSLTASSLTSIPAASA